MKNVENRKASNPLWAYIHDSFRENAKIARVELLGKKSNAIIV